MRVCFDKGWAVDAFTQQSRLSNLGLRRSFLHPSRSTTVSPHQNTLEINHQVR